MPFRVALVGEPREISKHAAVVHMASVDNREGGIRRERGGRGDAVALRVFQGLSRGLVHEHAGDDVLLARDEVLVGHRVDHDR